MTTNQNHPVVINPIELIGCDGFDKAFFRLLGAPNISTNEQAYEYLEMIYMQHFKRRRYANYASYRIAKIRRFNR